jgi:hypothetical protein
VVSTTAASGRASAMPLRAISKAVPWSIEVRRKGRPRLGAARIRHIIGHPDDQWP